MKTLQEIYKFFPYHYFILSAHNEPTFQRDKLFKQIMLYSPKKIRIYEKKFINLLKELK